MPVLRLLKRMVHPIAGYGRALYQRYVFWRALKQFSRLEDWHGVSASLIEDLIYGWNNPVWAAKPDLLTAVIAHAAATNGPIIECGSGLSTMVLGLIAKKKGLRVWSLEHDRQWGEKTRLMMKKWRIESVELLIAPLRSYGSFDWYDVPMDSMPKDIALVVCDGPPGETRGGRYGLLPIMRSLLKPGCVILLDDAHRPDEKQILAEWAQEAASGYAITGSEHQVGTLVVQRRDQEEILLTRKDTKDAKKDQWLASRS
jgi:predicted O-methyltransferase YrrM